MSEFEHVKHELAVAYAALLFGIVPWVLLEVAGVVVSEGVVLVSIAFWYTVLGWASRR